MPISTSDYFAKVGSPGNATTLASPGHTIGGTSFTVDSTALWPTDTKVTFAIDTVTITGGAEVRDTGSYTVWDGIVTNGTTISSCVLRYGTDQNYSAGSTTRVYILPTSTRENKIIDGLLVEHDQDGTHGAITASSITATTGTFTNLTVSGTATSQGWTPLGDVPDTVTANGNRNYDLVFNGVDHTSTLSPGMKLQLTRTVAAPDQCADLEASSSQYFSKSSPAGMTFTDDFVVSAWIKLESYGGGVNPQIIASRYNGTSGWQFNVQPSGTILLAGHNGGAANLSYVASYASIPLNKWVHVAAQLDMSTFTATTTTSYVMFDGLDVSATVARGGTNPTALVQAGNLEIGSGNATNFFDGKIAQVAIYSAKVTQATVRASMNQALSGSETSLISAYSFDNSINDLNANANNLTANGGAAATATDSPFANAVAAGLLEYAEINSVTFSTNTTVNVRVPDTCQIPTSGGVSAVSYSTQSNPYGLPAFSNAIITAILGSSKTTTSTTAVQIEGMGVTAYIPANKRVMIVAYVFLNNLTASKYSVVDLYLGAVGSGTKLGDLNVFTSATASAGGNGIIRIPYIAQTAGNVTFNLGLRTDGSGGTAGISSSTTQPAYLSVELS